MDWATLVEGEDYQVDTYNVDTSKDYQFSVYRILNIVIVQFDFFNKVAITNSSLNTAGVLTGLPTPARSFMRNACITGNRESYPIGVNAAGTLGLWGLPAALPAGNHLMGSFAYVSVK